MCMYLHIIIESILIKMDESPPLASYNNYLESFNAKSILNPYFAFPKDILRSIYFAYTSRFCGIVYIFYNQSTVSTFTLDASYNNYLGVVLCKIHFKCVFRIPEGHITFNLFCIYQLFISFIIRVQSVLLPRMLEGLVYTGIRNNEKFVIQAIFSIIYTYTILESY